MEKPIKDGTSRTVKHISQAITERLAEMGISKYSFCLKNGFNRATFDRVIFGKDLISLSSLIKFLDAANLEIRIVKKNED